MDNKAPNLDPYWGVIGIDSLETDYQIGSETKIPRASRKFQDNEVQYDQNDVNAYSCTLHGAMGAITDLTGYVFTLEDRKELLELAIPLGFDPKIGWYTRKAVDLVRNWYNKKFPNKKIRSFVSTIVSERAGAMLRLGYTAVVSHRGNSKYNKDKNVDGILNGIKFGDTTYGHCLRKYYSVGDEFDGMVNNYPSTHKFNIYKIPTANFDELVKNGVFYRACYFFVEDFKHESDVSVWAIESWEKAISLGVIPKQANPSVEVGGSALEETLSRLGGLSQKNGIVTLERLMVAYDRLGMLG